MEWIEDVRRQLIIRQYSANTQKAYLGALQLLGRHFAERNPRQLQPLDIEHYLLYLAEQKNYSFSGLNLMVNAIKFLFEKVWNLPKLPTTCPALERRTRYRKYWMRKTSKRFLHK